MGEVQGLVHVQSGLPSAKDEDDRLSKRHDSLRGLRVCWDCRTLRFVSSAEGLLKYMLITIFADYVDQQDGISRRSHGQALVQNNDFIGIASFNIFVGIAVATIFGSGFFFDLFWPERTETKPVRLAWKICSLTVSFMALADVLALTVRSLSSPTYMPRTNVYLQQVIVATRHAYITGVSPSYARTLFEQNGPPNPIYRKNAYCVAATVILWPGVIASFARLVSPTIPASYNINTNLCSETARI